MTEEPAQPLTVAPEQRTAPPPAAPRRRGLTPLLAGAGFVILAGAIVYVWRFPSIATPTPVDLQPIEQRLAAVEARLTRIEQERVPAGTVDLNPITARLDALEKLTRAEQAHGPGGVTDLGPITARLDALEQRPMPDVTALQARVAALEQRPGADPNTARDLATLVSRVATAEQAANKATARADRLARVMTAWADLAAGQKLGVIPDAPPALARFATTNPPTEAALRLAFPAAENAVLVASRPARDETTMVQRVLAQAEQLVIVRQGERVLIGDPASSLLDQARSALAAGDLRGAVKALSGLQGAPAQAIAGWLADATAVLDARAALADMIARP